MSVFYVLRYLPGTPMAKRKHLFTEGRFETFAEAEDARLASPVGELLDVYPRSDA